MMTARYLRINQRRRRIFFFSLSLITFILGLGCIALPVAFSQYAEKKHDNYIFYYQCGNLNRALAEIGQAIFYDSDNANYYWDRALVYWSLYKKSDANVHLLNLSREDWKRAIYLKKQDLSWHGWREVFFGLAQVEFHAGKFKLSTKYYEIAYFFTKDQVRKSGISVILGYIYYTEGDYKKAATWLSKVSSSDKEYFISCVRNGIVLQELKEFDKSKECFFKALSVNPDDAYLNLCIARLYAELREWDDAFYFLKYGLNKTDNAELVFKTLSSQNDFFKQIDSADYLKVYSDSFDRFAEELSGNATKDLSVDGQKENKRTEFFRSLNSIVIPSLNHSNPEVSDYSQLLLKKIKKQLDSDGNRGFIEGI